MCIVESFKLSKASGKYFISIANNEYNLTSQLQKL
jgi:hypothetical protein